MGKSVPRERKVDAKSVICPYFKKGNCKKGNDCNMDHVKDVRKTEACEDNKQVNYTPTASKPGKNDKSGNGDGKGNKFEGVCKNCYTLRSYDGHHWSMCTGPKSYCRNCKTNGHMTFICDRNKCTKCNSSKPHDERICDIMGTMWLNVKV